MSSLKRITLFMRPYKWVVIVGLVTVILPVMMELLVPRLLQFIIDDGIRAQDMTAITRGSLVMLASALVGTIATLGQGVCRAQLSQGMAFDMRNALFRRIQSFSFANLDQMQTGKLMTRVSSDVNVVRMFSSAGLALLLRASLMVLGSLVMMLLTDLRLSLVIIVLLALTGLFIWSLLRIATPVFMVVQQRLAELNTRVQENLAGVRVVRAYAREPYEIERFAADNDAYMETHIRVGRLMASVLPALLVLTNLGLALVLWQGGLVTFSGRLSVGELVAFTNYLLIGMAPLLLLGNILMMGSRAEASAERVLEVLEMEPAIQESPEAHAGAEIRGAVVFENVSFRYAGRAETGSLDQGTVQMNGSPSTGTGGPAALQQGAVTNGDGDGGYEAQGGELVLDRAAFDVKPGQRIALLGATGAGKSTLIHLIPRFYDTLDGRILIDGVDVRDWALADLRTNIGMVMQRTTLFSGTVRENIAYGRPDAPIEAVIRAARAAQAHDFIIDMPDGYASQVEARGANLSGGQKQRIAIARALLIDPGILILDDSTSAIDLETEYHIQAALEELQAGRTTIIVAQRINSVLNADQIFVLDNGRIADRGTHRELLETSAIYQEIYASQIGNVEQS